jgi:hypothetical protein
MPIINGPYRDPEEEHPPRRRKSPKALGRLRRLFTNERRLEVFRETFQREQENEEELQEFAEEYLRELYNSVNDEI